MKEKWHYLAVFYVSVYSLMYVLQYAILSALGYNYEATLLLAPLVLAITFLIAYGTARSQEAWNWSAVGFRRKDLFKSFCWAMALISPLNILIFIAVVAGHGNLLVASVATSPLVPLPVPVWYPLVAIARQLTFGITFLALLEAFPYENLLKYPKKYSILIIWALWLGLYGAPLLAPIGLGEIHVTDIIVFDFLFLVAYHKSRNSLGLILAYILDENPVWNIIYLAWGSEVIIIYGLVLGLLSMMSIAVLAYEYLRQAKKP